MKVFKFGGASIRDAPSFIRVADLLQEYTGQEILLVVSALGKTTNALEKVVDAYYYYKGNASALLDEVKQQHFNLLRQLISDPAHQSFNELNNTFVEIDWVLESPPNESFDYLYDQIVSIGELASTRMLAAYLNHRKIATRWLDVRDFIRTDNTYREGTVDWAVTADNISRKIPALLANQFVLTQGFLGGTSENFTTTLGREGSDYTAAIFGFVLRAENVTIWKDVAGVLNADPRYFPEAIKIDRLSYHEAIEMTYYGATVIHPKTLKPLQNRNIPLHVRSFLDPNGEGTVIDEEGMTDGYPPVLVMKKNQILISIYPKDFSFIAEDNLSHIFSLLSQHRVKVNVMQNSALSFSICADDNERIPPLLDQLKQSYHALINSSLELLTIRHYKEETIRQYSSGNEVMLEQKSRHTFQLVMKQE